MNDFTETPLLFGPEDGLFGMLTQPQGQHAGVGCLVLNTGVNHRVGPHRINVKTARRLAASGIPTLRFDLSGIGDSMAAQGRHGYRMQAIEDMKAALDRMQRDLGLNRFLVFGICSGAENAQALALADPRVVGMLSFDGEIYMTRWVRAERKLRRLAHFPRNAALRASHPWWHDLSRWVAAGDASARQRTLGRLGALLPRRVSAADRALLGGPAAPAVTAAEHERALLSLLDRGVAVSLMYSVTYNATDRDHGMLSQLRGSRMFGRLQYRFWPDIDHTVTTLDMQSRLLAAIAVWASDVADDLRKRPTTRTDAAGPAVALVQAAPTKTRA